MRKLEIGPGKIVSPGFESLDISPEYKVGNGISRSVDYIADASSSLPFSDGTFDAIYASHILEHFPWYKIESILEEWVRVLKPSGILEVWVPDGLKICKAFVDAENGNDYTAEDGWYKFNPEKDPCKWANGRIFTYGDGSGARGHSNWHLSLFSERYLKLLMKNIGMTDIKRIQRTEIGGLSNKWHSWINLGILAFRKGGIKC